jgi:hypothetical protein
MLATVRPLHPQAEAPRVGRAAPGTPAPIAVQAPLIGVALFDNDKEPRGGWACEAGSKTPVRVRIAQDLPSDRLWLSNAQKTSQSHNLRGSSYLRTTLNDIGMDLGFHSLLGHFGMDALPAIAETADRAVRLAVKSYAWTEPGAFMQYTLAEDLRLSMPPDAEPNPGVLTALVDAYQPNSSGLRVFFPGNPQRKLAVRINRLAHARAILSLPVPDPAWTLARGLPVEGYKRLDLALDDRYPSLCEVTITAEADQELAKLASFGQVAYSRSGHNKLRRWVAQPELVWLVKYFHVEIHNIWRSSGYVEADARYRLPAAFDDGYLMLSYAAGLVAESHLVAATNLNSNPRFRRPVGVTERAVWWRAYDRAQSFALALELYEAGFTPSEFWLGSVRVLAETHRFPELAEWALERGLIAPHLATAKAFFEQNTSPEDAS